MGGRLLRYGTSVAFAGLGMWVVAACSSSQQPVEALTDPVESPIQEPTSNSPRIEVLIDSFKYLPDPVTIHVGDSITWINEDPVGHTATAKNDSWDTGLFFNEKTITYDTAGTFPYFCGTHPEMTGTVVVEAGD
jgi:plastocyanin